MGYLCSSIITIQRIVLTSVFLLSNKQTELVVLRVVLLGRYSKEPVLTISLTRLVARLRVYSC